MIIFLLISSAALWLVVLFLGFLLLGSLRSLGLLRWRLDQLEATTPRRIGRDGLKIGKKAPDFTLPSAAGPDVPLRDFAGRKVLLVFTQGGCGPCKAVMPELNRLDGKAQVLVVNNGGLEATRQWAAQIKTSYPILAQESFSLSKQYEVYATPFAFLIDEEGVIRSKGIINNKQQIGFVLSGASEAERNGETEEEPAKTASTEA